MEKFIRIFTKFFTYLYGQDNRLLKNLWSWVKFLAGNIVCIKKNFGFLKKFWLKILWETHKINEEIWV
jgi:hypothetical protein